MLWLSVSIRAVLRRVFLVSFSTNRFIFELIYLRFVIDGAKPTSLKLGCWNNYSIFTNLKLHGTCNLSIDAVLGPFLLTLNILHPFFYTIVLFLYVVLLEINRPCIRFWNLYDLWCINLCFISMMPIHEC